MLVFWNETIDRETAIEITELLISKSRTSIKDWDKCKPPDGCNGYLETLQLYSGKETKKWFISYNDKNGSTRTTSIDWGKGL